MAVQPGRPPLLVWQGGSNSGSIELEDVDVSVCRSDVQTLVVRSGSRVLQFREAAGGPPLGDWHAHITSAMRDGEDRCIRTNTNKLAMEEEVPRVLELFRRAVALTAGTLIIVMHTSTVRSALASSKTAAIVRACAASLRLSVYALPLCMCAYFAQSFL